MRSAPDVPTGGCTYAAQPWLNRDGDYRDAAGASLRIARAVVPVLTVKAGRMFEPEWGPHAWGWEPQPHVS